MEKLRAPPPPRFKTKTDEKKKNEQNSETVGGGGGINALMTPPTYLTSKKTGGSMTISLFGLRFSASICLSENLSILQLTITISMTNRFIRQFYNTEINTKSQFHHDIV